MSSESDDPRSVLLNQVIADYLAAVESGNGPDREELIRQHSDPMAVRSDCSPITQDAVCRHFAVQDLLAALALDLDSGDEESLDIELTGETNDHVDIFGSNHQLLLPRQGKGKEQGKPVSINHP